MKLYLRLGLTAIVAIMFFNIFAVTETKAQGQGVLNEVLKRMETHRQSLTSLRTNITMDKYDPVIKESTVVQGKAIYIPAKGRDALIRVDWVKPEEILSVVNKQYVIYRPRLNQAITGKSDSAKGSGKANSGFSFLSMSKDQLKNNYSVKYLGQENLNDGTLTWHLEMMPKNASPYKSAEMWVDGNGMPLQIKISENSRDTTTLRFTNLEKNINLKASDVQVKLPKGTEIIKS